MLREPPFDIAGGGGGGGGGLPVTEVLRAALAPLRARIDAAFIYGPAAQAGLAGDRDIDFMIIGRDIAYADVIPHLIAAAKHIGRGIQPSVYTAREFTYKLAGGNRAVLAVMKQRKIFLVGADDAIPQAR